MHTQLLLILAAAAWVWAQSEPHKVAKVAKAAQQDEPSINTIPGRPGQDYPIFRDIPDTRFTCQGKIAGYYADTEAGCQVWHYCSQQGELESFLCANGTIFSQERRTCQWWYDTDCAQTDKFMDVNKDLYIIPETTTKPPKATPTEPALRKLQRATGF